MKKNIVLFFIIFVSALNAQMSGIVYDPTAQADRNKKTLMDKIHQRFMEQKTVQQMKMLMDNYKEGKKHYEYMKKIKEHKGGVVGYYKEKTVGRFKDFDKELLNGIEKDLNTKATKEERKKAGTSKWYIDSNFESFDKKVGEKLDFTDEINALDKALFEKNKKEKEERKKELEKAKDWIQSLNELEKAKKELDKSAEQLNSQDDYDKWDVKSQMIIGEYLKKLAAHSNAQELQRIKEEARIKAFDDKISAMLKAGTGNLAEALSNRREKRKVYDPVKELGRKPKGDRR